MKDEFQDFRMEIDSVNSKILVFDYENKIHSTLKYEEERGELISVSGEINETRNLLSIKEIESSKFSFDGTQFSLDCGIVIFT